MRYVMMVMLMLATSGCTRERTSSEPPERKEAAQLKPLIELLRSKVTSEKGKPISIPDMGPVAEKAIDEARSVAGDKFGRDAAKKANVSAYTGHRDLADGIWLFGGDYVGEDKQGKPFFVRWKAVMYDLDGPQCYSITLEEPTAESKQPFYIDWPYFDWNAKRPPTGTGEGVGTILCPRNQFCSLSSPGATSRRDAAAQKADAASSSYSYSAKRYSCSNEDGMTNPVFGQDKLDADRPDPADRPAAGRTTEYEYRSAEYE